jgi:polyphosphate kinase
VMGLKTHCKLSMIVRRDSDHLRRYVHMGTGNYNHITARFYTDLGLITAREDITAEVAEVFNLLTTHNRKTDFKKLLVAPAGLMKGMLDRIEREIEHARAGRPAAIIAKMNGLMDQAIMSELYRASQAGVEIDLIVRGICCLRAGVPGVSDNIRVYSIIGRFLEHSRVFYFANGGQEELWLGSADWMNRNLRGRVEVVFPIDDEDHKRRIYQELIEWALADRSKSRQMEPDGTYMRRHPIADELALGMQDQLMGTTTGDVRDPQ